MDKLGLHKYNIHNLNTGFENSSSSVIRQENYSTSQSRFSSGNINLMQNVNNISSNITSSSHEGYRNPNINSGLQGSQLYSQINQ